MGCRQKREHMGLVVKQGKDKFRWVMRQAFGTAEANFEAIQDENIPLLVPYGKEGRHILAKNFWRKTQKFLLLQNYSHIRYL